jgi:hypothetical protein
MEEKTNIQNDTNSNSFTNLISIPNALNNTKIPKQSIQKDKDIVDYIQPKYERELRNDIIVKYLTFIIIGTDMFIFFGSIRKTLY